MIAYFNCIIPLLFQKNAQLIFETIYQSTLIDV